MAVQRLEFWPKGTVAAYLPDNDPTYYIYTKALHTGNFTEVVVQLECDAPIGAVDARILVTPQIGNIGGGWEDRTSFSPIVEGGTFPTKETLKFTTIADHMRCKIALDLSGGNKPMLVAGTISITGVGRSED